MDANVAEICWIVTQRNEWAKERGKLRHKLRRAKEAGKPERAVKALKKRFDAVNSKKEKLNKHSLRLKRLLKKENGILRSNGNAGYRSILFRKDDRFMRILESSFKSAAAQFEATQALEKAISRGRVRS